MTTLRFLWHETGQKVIGSLHCSYRTVGYYFVHDCGQFHTGQLVTTLSLTVHTGQLVITLSLTVHTSQLVITFSLTVHTGQLIPNSWLLRSS